MLRLPPFTLQQPRRLDQAVAMIADDPNNTRLVAGGTDLWPNMKRRHQSAQQVVSLRDVPGLRGIHGQAGEPIRVGAMTTLTEITRSPLLREHYPAFVNAVASISSPVLRNMGTLGGNLCLDTRCTYYNQNLEWRQSISYCMKEEGSTCWVAPSSPRCWAISASDSAPMLCALAAEVALVSKEGERVIPLTALYNDDGIAYLTKKPDEILTEVRLPAVGKSRTAFWKLRRRGSIDFAVLTAGAAIETDGQNNVTDAKIYLGAVNSFPRACDQVQEALVGKPFTADNIEEAAAGARKSSQPMDNTDFLARWRGQMAVNYVEGVLREIAGLEPKVTPPPRAG